MAAPYTKVYNLVADSEQDTCLELRAPHRGTIRSIVMRQLDGDLGGYWFQLFNSEQARPVGSSSSSLAGSMPENSDAMYDIAGKKNVGAGEDLFEEREKNYIYRNKDGTHSLPIRKLYILIHPQGAGPKHFELRLDIETAVLD